MATKYAVVQGKLLRDGQDVGKVEIKREGRGIGGLEIEGPHRISVRRSGGRWNSAFVLYDGDMDVGRVKGLEVEYQGSRVALERRELLEFVDGSKGEVEVRAGGQGVGTVKRTADGVEAEVMDEQYTTPMLVFLALLSMYSKPVEVSRARMDRRSNMYVLTIQWIALMLLLFGLSYTGIVRWGLLAGFVALEAGAIWFRVARRKKGRAQSA